MKHKISIVVPTYGRLEAFVKLITSIENSDIAPDLYEVVVVSSDPVDSEKIVWLKNKKNIDIVLQLEADRHTVRNRSLYYYENVGIKLCKYDWVMVCNDDMWVESDWYQEFLTYVNDVNKVYLISSHIGGICLGLRIPSIGNIVKNGNNSTMWLYDMSIIHKHIYEEINFLDEKVQWYGKGADLSLAVAFFTDQIPVLCSSVRVNHDIIEENRQTNINGEPLSTNNENGGDFNYIRSKWDMWILNNGSDKYSYIWL